MELTKFNVRDVLSDVGFSASNWEELVSRLSGTIDTGSIKTTNLGDAPKCLLEAIGIWLQKDTHASWRKLADTIQKIHGYGPVTAQNIMDRTKTGQAQNGGSDPSPPRKDTPPRKEQPQPQPKTDYMQEKPTLKQFQTLKWKDDQGQTQRIHIKATIASQWSEVGIALGFDTSSRQEIASKYSNDVALCAEHLFVTWEKKGDNFTWDGLIEALEDAGFDNLAKDVKKALPYKV